MVPSAEWSKRALKNKIPQIYLDISLVGTLRLQRPSGALGARASDLKTCVWALGWRVQEPPGINREASM